MTLALATHAAASWGLSIALRAPMDINNPASLDSDSTENGIAQVNPLGGMTVLAPGYAVTTQALAHDALGITAGRAGFALTVDQPGQLPAAFAEANISGSGKLSGTPGQLIAVTITLDLHGRFIGMSGFPEISMRGTLSVNGVPEVGSILGDPGPGQVTSAIDWVIPAGLEAVQTTTWAFVNNDPSVYFAAAEPLVISSNINALTGQARISFLAEGGSEIFVEADLQGSARPLYSQPVNVSSAGDGQIDFTNTGILRVSLSEGASFIDATGVLASSTVVSSVPEPTSALLLLGGLAAVGWKMRASRGSAGGPKVIRRLSSLA
ncbi:MAG: PEP-CTERM sorting domain-containing protein [Gammaproteobacteria bacterium]|nr:PEP-CTERM sorting domain-containing protein [Gammaproteobacteria bacterium]